MSEINIDARLVRDGGAALSRTDERLVEMTNGCICCTLREDLLMEVARLAREGRFDYLLIESTGISEPLPVAETFTFEDENGKALADYARLDTMVTIVDAYNFMRDFQKAEELRDRDLALSEDDERTIVDLLVDQVEFANVLVVNKVDLVSEDERLRLEAVLRRLNPSAKIVMATRGQVPLNDVLNTGRFNFAHAALAPEWLNGDEHTPETEEYGISSFVYRARRPFHPQRLMNALESDDLNCLIRSKGIVWLATRYNDVCVWSQAGLMIALDSGGMWWSTVERAEWPEIPEWRAEIERTMEGEFGDRRQEIVLIGEKMDHTVVKQVFDGCLLTDAEMALGRQGWRNFADSFFSGADSEDLGGQ